jgi:membrane-associated phospholipid phosphatase
MVNALVLGREGTVDPTHTAAYGAPNGFKAVDAASELERWEPWVRAYTVLGDLLSGIDFKAETGGNGSLKLRDRLGGGRIAKIIRPSLSTFQSQIPLVLSWADLRYERANEILAQIDPQYAFWSSIVPMRPDRTRWTLELINITLQFCVYVEMRFKHALGCWRPIDFNPQIQPMITTPGHGSFPSGHATQAYAVAHVLASLLKLDPAYGPKGGTSSRNQQLFTQLHRQAGRIATNRVVAGVHFPIDSMAGRMLGVALGEYIVARSGALAPNGHPRKLTYRRLRTLIDQKASLDFNPFSDSQNLDNAVIDSIGIYHANRTNGSATKISALLETIWTKSSDEWTGRF